MLGFLFKILEYVQHEQTIVFLSFPDQPMRGPPPAVPPTQAAGETGVGNLIDLDTPSPQVTAQTQNPLAPASSSDLQQRLAGMSKSPRFHWVQFAGRLNKESFSV